MSYPQFSNAQKRLYFEQELGELPNQDHGWHNILCPLHSDKTNSGSINLESWLFNCHAGCTGGKALDIYGFEMTRAACDFRNAREHLEGRLGTPQVRNYTAKFIYHDPQGNKHFAVGRVDLKEGGKRFEAFHKDAATGAVILKRPEVLYPYNVHRLAGAEIVWIVEGEKCADILYDVVNPDKTITTTTTTNPFGAGKWEDEYSQYLSGKHCIVIPDNDKPGLEHARKVANSALKYAASVRVVPLPEMEKGDDIEQFRQVHGERTYEKLAELLRKAELWQDTPPDSPATQLESPGATQITVDDGFPKTDIGNAELFAAKNSGKWLYDHTRGWFRWAGHWWERDEQRKIINSITELMRSRGEAKQEQITRIDACERLSRSFLPYPHKSWNQDPLLLAVNNGVIELPTGTFRPGKPDDYINIHMDVDFNPTAKCAKWEKFIADIMNNDPEMVGFLKRAIGYSMSGSTKEQVMFLCCGAGSNGKNTLVDTLKLLLGDYGKVTQFYTFLNSLNGDSAGSQSALAGLSGARFVVASEAPQNSTLSSSKLKGFVHGDPQNAKFMHKDFFEFTPQAKLWLTTNDKPKVNDSSEGFWRSIYIIPFEVTFSEANGNVDKNLKSALEAERAGILNWLLQGFAEYQKNGLKPPSKVVDATKEYQESSSPIAEFITEECEIGEGLEIKPAELYKAYAQWSEHHSIKPISHIAFGTEMKRPNQPWNFKHGKKGNVYEGIRRKQY